MNFAWPGRVVPFDVLKLGNVFMIPGKVQPVVGMRCGDSDQCLILSPAKDLPVGSVVDIHTIWTRPVLRLDTPILSPVISTTPEFITHGPEEAHLGRILQHTETARMFAVHDGARVMVNIANGVITPMPADDVGTIFTRWSLILKTDGVPNQTITSFHL